MGGGDKEAWLAAPSLDIRSLLSLLSRKQLKHAQARSDSLHPPSQHSKVEQENETSLSYVTVHQETNPPNKLRST